jgi:hypothetical protein
VLAFTINSIGERFWRRRWLPNYLLRLPSFNAQFLVDLGGLRKIEQFDMRE